MHRQKKLLWLIALILAGGLFEMRSAEAIPAWARRYNADCTMCHTMLPRLNTMGHKFRRLGYRMPDEFDTAGADIAWDELAKVANYIAARGRGRVVYTNAKGTPATFSFSEGGKPDVTLFYAGPVSRNFSFFFELPFEPAGELEVGQIMANFGSSDRFFFSRIGQFHQFSRVGYGGLDRPIGLSNPQVFDVRVNGFRPRLDNVGVEMGFSAGNFTGLIQATNGITATGGAAMEGTDPNKAKDLGVLFEYLIPDRDASVSLLYVYGRAPMPLTDADADGDIDDALAGSTGTRYHRIYVFADHTFEPLGLKPLIGGGIGFDNQFITGLGTTAAALLTASNSRSWFSFVELDQRLNEDLYADVRFDYYDPTNQGEATAATRKSWMGSGGLVWKVQRFLRLAAEYQVMDNKSQNATHQARGEMMLNF